MTKKRTPSDVAAPLAPPAAAPDAAATTLELVKDAPSGPTMQTHQVGITLGQFKLIQQADEIIAKTQQEQRLVIQTILAGAGFDEGNTELVRVHEVAGQKLLEIRRAAPFQAIRKKKRP